MGDSRYHRRQCIGDGYQFGQTALRKDYLRRKFCICFELGSGFCELDPKELFAIFGNLNHRSVSKSNNTGRLAVNVDHHFVFSTNTDVIAKFSSS